MNPIHHGTAGHFCGGESSAIKAVERGKKLYVFARDFPGEVVWFFRFERRHPPVWNRGSAG
jgi:hypothetical protein